MTIIKICAVILISFCATLITKEINTRIKIFIPIAAFTIISITIIPNLYSKLQSVISEYNISQISEYILILSKALGISFLCAVTSEICSECGEHLLSEITIFAGKAEILVLCIPLIKSLLEISVALI